MADSLLRGLLSDIRLSRWFAIIYIAGEATDVLAMNKCYYPCALADQIKTGILAQ